MRLIGRSRPLFEIYFPTKQEKKNHRNKKTKFAEPSPPSPFSYQDLLNMNSLLEAEKCRLEKREHELTELLLQIKAKGQELQDLCFSDSGVLAFDFILNAKE